MAAHFGEFSKLFRWVQAIPKSYLSPDPDGKIKYLENMSS